MQQKITRTCRTIATAVLAGALIGPRLAMAQQPHPAAVGDLMTALVQPRHIKLGLAGSEQNWPYAAYELDQLRETFADLAQILPKYRDLSIPDLITSTVKEPLAAVDPVQRLPQELRSHGDRNPASDGPPPFRIRISARL